MSDLMCASSVLQTGVSLLAVMKSTDLSQEHVLGLA